LKPDTGVLVTIGIAEMKTLAKLANHLAKNSKKAEGVLDLIGRPTRKWRSSARPSRRYGASAPLIRSS
jgi:DNA polymerase V